VARRQHEDGVAELQNQNPISPSGTKSKPMSFSLPVAFADVDDVYYSGDNDDDSSSSSSVEVEALKYDSSPKKAPNPIPPRPGLKRGISIGNMTFSTHSLKSTRSQLSIDMDAFEDDPPWKQVLRYLHLLPPHKHEKPLKRKVRVFTWVVLFCDFIGALVAIGTYDGATSCCGVPIFEKIVTIDWDTCFRVATCLYLIVVLAEIIPVVRRGLPFNLLNPTLGFAITFAMFFDDSVAQAVTMWILEALAIFFEFLIYRIKATIYRDTTDRLDKIAADLAHVKRSQKNILAASRHGGSQHFNSSRSGALNRSNSGDMDDFNDEDDDDDDDSLSGHSFGENDSNPDMDDIHDQRDPTGQSTSSSRSLVLPLGSNDETKRDRSFSPSGRTSRTMDVPPRFAFPERGRKKSDDLGVSAHSMASMLSHAPLPWERKQMRLLRERRILRQKQKQEKVELRFHLIGTCINGGLLVISLILIIAIASTGGLCLYDGAAKVFSTNQLGKCNQCIGTEGVCQICNADGNNQCYYPYY
jgi:hypothetical protein